MLMSLSPERARADSRALGSRTFDGRLQLVEYKPTVLAGPPDSSRSDA